MGPVTWLAQRGVLGSRPAVGNVARMAVSRLDCLYAEHDRAITTAATSGQADENQGRTRASRSPTPSSILHLVMRHLRFILVRACALPCTCLPIWGGCEHTASVSISNFWRVWTTWRVCESDQRWTTQASLDQRWTTPNYLQKQGHPHVFERARSKSRKFCRTGVEGAGPPGVDAPQARIFLHIL